MDIQGAPLLCREWGWGTAPWVAALWVSKISPQQWPAVSPQVLSHLASVSLASLPVSRSEHEGGLGWQWLVVRLPSRLGNPETALLLGLLAIPR